MSDNLSDIKFIKDILGWDILSWQAALTFWEKSVPWKDVKLALELGANKGGLSLWLARKNIQVVCSDINSPQEIAQALHLKYKVEKNISYEKINALSIPYQNYFDLIVFKSILGGIGRNNQFEHQKQCIRQIHQALKPGGLFLFAENLTASTLHRFARKNFVSWGKDWRYVSLKEIPELMQNFSDYEIKTTGFLAAFGRSEKQRMLLAKIDNLAFNKIIPCSWQYIVYGIAIK